MICLGKEKFDNRFNIDDNAIITDLNGNIQELNFQQGRYRFHGIQNYKILMWTKYGYRDTKIWDIHHLDENPLNNNLDNLVFLTHSEHRILHNKNRHMSEETKRKLSNSQKGKLVSAETRQKLSENNSCYWKDKQFSENHRKNLSESHKGKHWKKDPITGIHVYY